MIEFKCRVCGEHMSVPSSLAGQQETCPGCGRPVTVPAPERKSLSAVVTSNPTVLRIAGGVVFFVGAALGAALTGGTWRGLRFEESLVVLFVALGICQAGVWLWIKARKAKRRQGMRPRA